MDKKYDIVALGEVLIDFTPAGRSESGMLLFEQNPGGAPVNMLTAAAKNGFRTAFIGKVGNDMHGQFLKDTMEAEEIDTEGLVVADDVFTTLAFVALKENGERTFSFARKPGADTKLCYKELNQKIVRDTRVFHIGSLSLTDEPARTTTFQAVRMAKESGALISYDPNYRQPLWESREEAMERMCSLLPYVDLLKISDEETELLTPYKEPEAAAEYLIKKGIRIVAVTLGADGVLVAAEGKMKRVPGYKSRAVDTTGAGDSFWGGFISEFLRHECAPEDLSTEQLEQCARFGNATASLCVEKRGGIPDIPDRKTVEARMQE